MDDLISRQAAIDKIVETSDEIYKIKQKGATYPHDDFFQGMAYAENIVKHLPPASSSEIPNSSDTISRAKAIEALETVGYDFSETELSEVELEEVCGAVGDVRQDMIDRIKRLPPAQPERIRGRWTRDNACSECGCQPWFSGDIHNYNFCPNCGAEMRER